jgi:DNA polymerase III delta prime subunit
MKPKQDDNGLPTRSTFIGRDPKDYILMFYGPPGVGKTTFASRLGKVLFLSTDRGTRHLDAMRVECNDWAKFEKTLKKVERMEDPSAHYDFIAIDHLADWHNMAEDQTCVLLGVNGLSEAGYGKGWKEYKRLMRSYVQRILALGIGVILIAHEKTEVIKNRSIELNRTSPGLQKTAWDVIVPITDMIAYCGFRTVTVRQGDKKKRKEVRVLETVPREDLYLKDRTVREKPEEGYEPLNARKFLETFKSASSKTTQE